MQQAALHDESNPLIAVQFTVFTQWHCLIGQVVLRVDIEVEHALNAIVPPE